MSYSLRSKVDHPRPAPPPPSEPSPSPPSLPNPNHQPIVVSPIKEHICSLRLLKGRAPLGELSGKRKRTPSRKSKGGAEKSTEDGGDGVDNAGAAAEDLDDSSVSGFSCSEADESTSNLGSPFVASPSPLTTGHLGSSPPPSSPLTSLIEQSWKSGIAELIGGKKKTGGDLEGEQSTPSEVPPEGETILDAAGTAEECKDVVESTTADDDKAAETQEKDDLEGSPLQKDGEDRKKVEDGDSHAGSDVTNLNENSDPVETENRGQTEEVMDVAVIEGEKEGHGHEEEGKEDADQEGNQSQGNYGESKGDADKEGNQSQGNYGDGAKDTAVGDNDNDRVISGNLGDDGEPEKAEVIAYEAEGLTAEAVPTTDEGELQTDGNIGTDGKWEMTTTEPIEKEIPSVGSESNEIVLTPVEGGKGESSQESVEMKDADGANPRLSAAEEESGIDPISTESENPCEKPVEEEENAEADNNNEDDIDHGLGGDNEDIGVEKDVKDAQLNDQSGGSSDGEDVETDNRDDDNCVEENEEEEDRMEDENDEKEEKELGLGVSGLKTGKKVVDDNFNDAFKVPDDPFPLPDTATIGDDDDDSEEEEEEEAADQEAQKLAALFKDPEEAALESLVFGDTDEIVQELEKKEEKKKKRKKKKKNKDVSPSEMTTTRKRKLSDEVGEEELGVFDKGFRKTAAWSDEDDDDELMDASDLKRRQQNHAGVKRKENNGADAGGVIQGGALKKKLKREFEKVMGETPAWALGGEEGKKKKKKNKSTDGDDDDDDDDDKDDDENPLLTRAGNFLKQSKGKKLGFAGGMLDYKKCCRANRQEKCNQIKDIHFHPSAQVLMTSGFDETLRLYQVDGVENPKIQSVAFERFPIHRSAFTLDGGSVVITSKKPWFKIYDMMTGNTTHVPAIKNKLELNKFRLTPDGRSIAFLGPHGYVYVVDLSSKEIVSTVKMNSRVRDVAFLNRGSTNDDVMLTHGDDGFVYVWDYRRTASCLHKFVDDGCISGTSVTTSPDSRYIACGSTSGILNIYDADEALRQSTPKPRKTLQNLVTTIRDVEFNRTNELMAFATGEMMNGVRMCHVPTMNVFSNFPAVGAIAKPRSIAFSPFSGYFAVADSKDIVNLFRLNHYENF